MKKKKLRRHLHDAYIELNKLEPSARGIFDHRVWRRAREYKSRLGLKRFRRYIEHVKSLLDQDK